MTTLHSSSAASPAAPPEPYDAGYVLDSTWHAERARLDNLAGFYDPGTMAISERLGLTTGWRCLEVGAGTGTVTVQYAERVGPDGEVLAVDADPRFIAPLANETISVLTSDVTTEPLPEGRFDLVHARLLLEHLAARSRVLQSMVAAARPGGWVLVEDLDWAPVYTVEPPSQVHQRVVAACEQYFRGRSSDPHYGRKLPQAFKDAGLTDIGTQIMSAPFIAHPEHGLPAWEFVVDQIASGLLAQGLVTQDDLDAFHELWHDGVSFGFGPLMVSTWGRRPSHDV